MELRLVTPATADIVTLAEAKAHLRVLSDDEDSYIEALCAAVRDHLTGEGSWLGISVVPETWELTTKRFPWGSDATLWPATWAMVNGRPRDALPLPRPPLSDVTGVFYTPSGGSETEITDYRLIGGPALSGAYLLPAKGTTWPVTDGEPGSVRVRYTSGFASPPKPIKHAALLMIAHLYENREAVGEAKMSEMPMAVGALLAPYRSYYC